VKRASYREGVAWIAFNDDPENLNPEEVAYYISSLLLSDLFDVEPERVGRDVVRKRKQLAKQSREGEVR
jgi:hypothetical protein